MEGFKKIKHNLMVPVWRFHYKFVTSNMFTDAGNIQRCRHKTWYTKCKKCYEGQLRGGPDA